MLATRKFITDLVQQAMGSVHVVGRTTPGTASAGPHAVFAPVPALLISFSGERRHRYASADGQIHSVRLLAMEALLVTPGTWLETTYVCANDALSLRSHEHHTRAVYIEARPDRGETLHRGHPAQVLEFRDDGDRLAAVMGALVASAAPRSDTYLQASATIILHELAQALLQPLDLLPAAAPDATWQALLNWVEETVGARARREEAAAALRVHPNHVSRVCRNHGTTYSRVVHSTRIRYAQELLDSTPLTASEIAYRCGYSDPPNFHHQFRRHAACTPAEYRAGQKSRSES